MANLIPIDDPDDPRVAAYRDIRERDLVGRRGLFVAEGRVVLNTLLASPRFIPQSLLLLESRVAGAADLIDRVPTDVPIYVAAAHILDRIAGFPMHRGILAIGMRTQAAPSAADIVACLPERATVVVLVGASNHDNVGAVFRNAAAFGAATVLLDETSCDPLYRKAIRVSVGHVFSVPFAHGGPAADLLKTLDTAGLSTVALSPAGKVEIGELRLSGRIALVIGSEGAGLPIALLHRLTTVRIPIEPGVDSLNLAAASAIALQRLYKPQA